MIGAIAQLVERVLCKHEVVGSTPTGSTKKAYLRDRGKQVSSHPGFAGCIGKMTS